MVDKVVVVRYIHWESHLVQNLDLTENYLLRFQVGGGYLLLVVYQMLILLVILCQIH